MTVALLPVFQPASMLFEHGEGAWLTTNTGERYLDFGAGIAVNALGYTHPHVVEALERQGRKLWHLSNVYRVPEAERLAERLTSACFADLAFFANSGAEANECAIKIARRYQHANGHPERWRIITFHGAFHGRTLATMAAGGNGNVARSALENVAQQFPDLILEIRGRGLMLGIRTILPAQEVAEALRWHGKVLTIPAGDDVVRVLPPLIVTDEEIQLFVERLRLSLRHIAVLQVKEA